MKVSIKAGKGQGKVILPPSKSLFHRALFCAALSEGESHLYGRLSGDDLEATCRAIAALGGKALVKDGRVTVKGATPLLRSFATLDCASSGTTLRLSIPLLLLSGEPVKISMREQLAERPLDLYKNLFSGKGVLLKQEGNELFLSGKLAPGEYALLGNVSSQFVSGLLLALPLLDGDSRIVLTSPLESAPYVEMTRQVQKVFSVETEQTPDGFLIRGGQSYRATDFRIEGDATIAAVYETLNSFGNRIEPVGLPQNSMQGDARFPALAKQVMNGETVDLADTPDLAPQLFALAAYYGAGHFTSTRRLAYKESDRALSMKEELAAFGIDLQILDNEVYIKGNLHAPDRTLSCHNDHRIAMALATLCTLTGGILDGAECVGKSYPEFWKDLRSLGFEVK